MTRLAPLPLRSLLPALALTLAACTVVPNPLGLDDGVADTGSEGDGSSSESGSGDAGSDGSTDTSSDGSTDTTTDTTTDTGCMVKEEGCPCAGSSCDAGLVCVDGLCVDESTCGPINEDVALYYELAWNADPLEEWLQLSCAANLTISGDSAALLIEECDDAVAWLLIQLDPALSLGEVASLPVILDLYYLAGQLYARASVGDFVVLLVDASTLSHEFVSAGPWSISALETECLSSAVDCGLERRLGVGIDELILYDQNAGDFAAGSAWVDTAVDSCGLPHYTMAVIGI